jgi:hypothetical protein
VKKTILFPILIFTLVLFTKQLTAQRFLSEVFPSVTKTTNVIYASNFSILTGAPILTNLSMDVYEPGGAADPMLHRPLIILMHPGNFLPTFINMSPTGSKNDSAIVEMCTGFAKRGYVAVAMSYRQGSNPFAPGGGINLDIRKGTMIQAIYRAMQDAKCCVRYFKADEATTNTFRIDSTKIIIGGMGSGGFVSLAYATLNNLAEIAIPKFIATNSVGAPYNFISGQPYINIAQLGDFDGYGGNASYNFPNNSPGHTNNVSFVFNIGGALADSSWIDPGNAPMVAFHVIGDPYIPYNTGLAFVPSSSDTLFQVSGSNFLIPYADQSGNNNCFLNAGFTDVYTQHANLLNSGFEGLYPFSTNPSAQVAPWEWYDSLATVAGAQAVGINTGGAIFHDAVLDNPGMSKIKALAYIDTIMGYLNPRIVYCLNLVTGISEQERKINSVEIFPNPAIGELNIKTINNNEHILKIELYDVTGERVLKIENVNQNFYKINRQKTYNGIYLIKISFANKTIIQKIIFN